MSGESAFLTQDLSEVNVIFIHSVLDEVGLTASQFRVYAHLARRANQVGKAWPGVDSMAHVCRLNRDTIIETVKELEAFGMIFVERRTGQRNIYRLTPPSIWHLPEMRNGSNQSEIRNAPVGNKDQNQSEIGNVSISKKVIKEVTPSADAESVAIAFGEFWEAYPRHTAKATAEKAFIKHHCFEKIEVILKSITKHKQTDQWQRAIVPHAATWINQKRWEDELTNETNKPTRARSSEKRGGKTNAEAVGQYSGAGRVR